MPVFTFSNRATLFGSYGSMPGAGPYHDQFEDLLDEPGPVDYAIPTGPDHANPSDGCYAKILGNGDGTSNPYDGDAYQTLPDHYAANTASWNAVGVTGFDSKSRLITETFGSAVDSAEDDAGESFHIKKVGSTWVMTGHSKDMASATIGQGDDASVQQQRTWRATASSFFGPWTYDGIILENSESLGNGHTGYFRWGLNPGLDQPYAYIGYSLGGGGSNSPGGIMWGTNDPVAGDWTFIAHVGKSRGAIGETNGQQTLFQSIDPETMMFKLPTGEWAALTQMTDINTAGEVGSNGRLAMIVLDPTGTEFTREVEVVFEQGATGDDSEEMQYPHLFPDPTDPGAFVCIYQGGANGVNTTMIAKCVVDVTADLPPVLTRPRHTKLEFDLTGATLPSGVSAVTNGSATVTSQAGVGVLLSPGGNGVGQAVGLEIDTTVDLSDTYAEIEVDGFEQVDSTLGQAVTRIGFAADGDAPGNPDDGVQMISFASNNPRADIVVRASGSDVERRDDVFVPFGSNVGDGGVANPKRLSFAWDPDNLEFVARLGQNASNPIARVTQKGSGSGFDQDGGAWSSIASGDRKAYVAVQNEDYRVTRMTFRIQDANGDTVPTFTVTATTTEAEVTFDRDVLGASGLVAFGSSSGLLGTVAQRQSSRVYRILFSSPAALGETVTVTYGSSVGDIVSQSDRVEVANITSAQAIAIVSQAKSFSPGLRNRLRRRA
ncbi:MAG: hypothetical protein AAF108_02875 [Planctomycetota bacterium]